MKKSLFQIIVFFILITVVLTFLQRHLFKQQTTAEGEVTPIDHITETKEVSLSKWLELYNKGTYKKIEIKDGTDMDGFVLVGTGIQESFLLFSKAAPTNEFLLITSKKPLDTTISELGISLTGATSVITSYTEATRWMRILEQFGVMLLILFVFIFGARFLLGKGNGAGGLLNVQVGKKSNKNADKKTKFTDIAGMEEVKNELIEVVDYLKNPDKYKKV
jgi:ATP-dependent Zn protease